jgi:hypothetical protein
MRLSALWATVSLAAQSIMGCSPVDVSQAGVVEEMLSGFRSEQSGAHVSSCLA